MYFFCYMTTEEFPYVTLFFGVSQREFFLLYQFLVCEKGSISLCIFFRYVTTGVCSFLSFVHTNTCIYSVKRGVTIIN